VSVVNQWIPSLDHRDSDILTVIPNIMYLFDAKFIFFDTPFCVFAHISVYIYMFFTLWVLVIRSDSGFILVFTSIIM
jgi:hypothetical protein